MYRLVVLGDLDLGEMENVNPTFHPQEDGTITMSDPAPTHFFWIVRGTSVFVSFVMGLAMANIFIAILCVSYQDKHEQAMVAFMRRRAHIILDIQTVVTGARRISTCCLRRKKVELDLQRATSDLPEDVTDAFIWLCSQTKT